MTVVGEGIQSGQTPANQSRSLPSQTPGPGFPRSWHGLSRARVAPCQQATNKPPTSLQACWWLVGGLLLANREPPHRDTGWSGRTPPDPACGQLLPRRGVRSDGQAFQQAHSTENSEKPPQLLTCTPQPGGGAVSAFSPNEAALRCRHAEGTFFGERLESRVKRAR